MAGARKGNVMSARGLQKIVGKAVISDSFRDGILGERRAELVGGFDLEPDELMILMALQVETLVEFAGAVEEVINSRQTPTSLRHTPELLASNYGRYSLSVVGLPVRE